LALLLKGPSCPEGGIQMSATGLATVMFMVFVVMIVMSFWRQIAIFILYFAVTVFCFGVYYIVSIVTHLI
jgi:uncharacterized membrane protein YtjA (UPF0391 family)